MTAEQQKIMEAAAIEQAVEEFMAEDGIFYGLSSEVFEEKETDDEEQPYSVKEYVIETTTEDGEDFEFRFQVERAEETILVDTLFDPAGNALAKKLVQP